MSGKHDDVRSVEIWIDEDTRKMESYGLGPDGTEFKNMEIPYERQ
jgi:hypothetical protein